MPPLAPRPFSQIARRHLRQCAGTYFGYTAFISPAPWYRQRRRRSKFRPNKTLARHVCMWRAFKARARARRPQYVEAA